MVLAAISLSLKMYAFCIIKLFSVLSACSEGSIGQFYEKQKCSSVHLESAGCFAEAVRVMTLLLLSTVRKPDVASSLSQAGWTADDSNINHHAVSYHL